MITVNNLAFSYGSNEVLRNINLTLRPGNIYGLLGENGVGKTTLLTLLSGLKKPNQGSIDIDGQNPWKRNPEFLSRQYYLSEDVIAPRQRAQEWAKTYGKFWPEFSLEAFTQIMQEFETDPTKKMNEMSTGQLKKTHISFALSRRPKYLYMDEPTNGLDIPSKAQFRSALMKYTAEDSIIVISTHQVRDLENVIDPIIILDKCDVLLNASLSEISDKLYFDYGTTLNPNSLYSEQLPGGFIQVYPNTLKKDSKVNIEALFNAVHAHKDTIKTIMI